MRNVSKLKHHATRGRNILAYRDWLCQTTKAIVSRRRSEVSTAVLNLVDESEGEQDEDESDIVGTLSS